MKKEILSKPYCQKAGKNSKRDKNVTSERKRCHTKAKIEMHQVEVDQNKAVDEEGKRKRKRNKELLAL